VAMQNGGYRFASEIPINTLIILKI
jgi:hypothetical protein